MGAGKSKSVLLSSDNQTVGLNDNISDYRTRSFMMKAMDEKAYISDLASSSSWKSNILSEEQFNRTLRALGISSKFESVVKSKNGLDYASISKINSDPETAYIFRKSISALNSIVNAFNKTELKGNPIINNFNISNSISNDSNVLGRTSKYKTGLINRQTKYSIAITPKALNRFNTRYISMANTLSSGTVSHELGHAVYNHILNNPKMGSKLNKFTEGTKSYSAVSVYGNKNIKEAFAEAFSLYVIGESSTKMGADYYSAFMNFMSQNGLDSFYNCVN